MIAIVIAAFLFQPFREWIQARLDRFFYPRPPRLSPHPHRVRAHAHQRSALRSMLGSVMDRLSRPSCVDRIAFSWKIPCTLETCASRAPWCASLRAYGSHLPRAARPEFARGALFFESPRAAREVPDSVRQTLEQLDLNYFVPCRIREHTVAVLGSRQNG